MGAGGEGPGRGGATVWAVAGCLFEVSLPQEAAGSWRWVNPRSEVTMVAQELRGGEHHFRFRAEAVGAHVELRFQLPGGDEVPVLIHIAPERLGE